MTRKIARLSFAVSRHERNSMLGADRNYDARAQGALLPNRSTLQRCRVVRDVLADKAGDEVVAVVIARLATQA